MAMALSQSELKLINSLKKLGGRADAESLAKEMNEPIYSIFSLSQLLKEKNYVSIKEIIKEWYELTDEGRKCLENGLPETRIYKLLENSGGELSIDEIKKFLNEKEISAAIGWG
ncbi:MAG: hypothetical protein QXG78_03215, partial [Candidatus Methanomethyliaceae archaeon]